MILGSVVLLALLAGPADPLAPARAMFTQGDYAGAEAAALEAARPPVEGAALYLAGLARFRAGKAGPALELLERAGRAADPPDRGPWQFNRGACLYELGRFEEAEGAFAEAAEQDPGLAALALANAGFAALDAGARGRARALADRARVAGQEAPPPALAELEEALGAGAADAVAGPAAEAHRAGLAAYDAGRYAEAEAHFRRAASLAPGAPSGARSAIMAAAAALARGERAAARDQLADLLAGPVEDPERRLAADYLDAASRGLAARGAGWEVTARAAAGWDGHVTRSGEVEQRRASGQPGVASAFLDAGGSLARRWRLGDGCWLQLAYGIDQLAYLDGAAEDYSLQQHLLAAGLELQVGPRLRLGLEGQGGLDLTGLSAFRGLQATLGPAAWAAWDLSDLASLRLDLAWSHRWAPRQEFAYLGGDRREARLTGELRLGAARLELGYRLRDEALGSLAQAVTFQDFFGSYVNTFVLPQGYTGHALLAGVHARLARLELGLAAGHEWRAYGEGRVEQQTAGGTAVYGRASRRDERTWAGAVAGWSLTRALTLAVRYDLTLNRSSAAGPQGCPPGGGTSPDPGWPGPRCSAWADERFDKHAVALEAVLGW